MRVDSPSPGRQDSFPAGSPQGPPNLCCAPRQAVPPPTRARSSGLGVLRAPRPPRTTFPAQPTRKLRAGSATCLGRHRDGLSREASQPRPLGPGLLEGSPWAGHCTQGGSQGHPQAGRCTRGGSPLGRPLLSPGPQAVPGPLVLPKQGLAVSRHTGHKCARGCPELSLRCVSCSCAPEPCTPVRAQAQAQPSLQPPPAGQHCGHQHRVSVFAPQLPPWTPNQGIRGTPLWRSLGL